MIRLVGVLCLVLGGCTTSSHTTATPQGDAGEQGFRLEIAISGIGSGADSVAIGQTTAPITAGAADLFINFPNYSAAVAAGDLTVSFLSAGQVVTTGDVRTGACINCVYDGCPTQTMITLERQEFYGTQVSPNDMQCFTCAGGGKNEKACP